MHLTWEQLIEAPTAQLHVYAVDPALSGDIGLYARALSYYMRGDREALALLLEKQSADDVGLNGLLKLRLKIRARDVNALELEELSKLELPGVLNAELNFSLAVAWEIAGRDENTSAHFQKAAGLYRAAGCPRKALRSYYNFVAAESRLRPHKNYVAEYQAVIEMSKSVGDVAFEGMALTMISREYQIVELHDQALQMVDRALLLMEAERGALHFAHALLQKAHLLLDGERNEEGLRLIAEAEMAPFPEILAAARLLRSAFMPGAVWDRAWEKDLLPTWRNRLPQLSMRAKTGVGPQISELEARLLKIIYNGPVEKWDLIERLYPAGGSALTLENRFKNLINRVRKKYPEKILCQDGRYSLTKLPGELQ